MSLWEEDRSSAINELLNRSVQAIRQITVPRFYNTERGFAAEFYCYIKQQLNGIDMFPEHTIAEMEVQKRKSDHYGVIQRPDILIHIPIETGLTNNFNENNFVDFAFKLNKYRQFIKEDFDNLDEMFEFLNYDAGFLIHISAYPRTYLNIYEGDYKSRIHELTIGLDGEHIRIKHSYFVDNKHLVDEV